MSDSRILLGVIGRPHGVRGLVRVASYTADPADLAAYGPLADASGRSFVLCWRGPGIAAVTEMSAGGEVQVADRDAAERLAGTQLFLDRDRLPPPGEDEFYLADLIGLAAVAQDGAPLGRVVAVHDYGAGASLEIECAGAPPMLVPFNRACVPLVEVGVGRVMVVAPHEVAASPEPVG